MAGLALVALLVPVLGHWQGADGPLGPSIPLFFLVPVLFSSAVGGRGIGVVVSIVAVLVWDWYFITPLYTVTVGTARDVLALVVFLAVAILTGQLSRIARRRAEEALRRARGSEALYSLLRGRIVDELVAYAQAHGVTHVVIGHPTHSRWYEFLHGSVTRDLLRRLPGVDIHVYADRGRARHKE